MNGKPLNGNKCGGKEYHGENCNGSHLTRVTMRIRGNFQVGLRVLKSDLVP